MNKSEFIKIIDNLNLDKEEYYILGGGSLLMHGIRESASDIDLCVSMELFDELKEKYNLDDSKKNNCGFYKINDLIEIIPNEKKDFTRYFISEYPVKDLERILNIKKSRNKEKDLKDIEKITIYLEKNK